MGNEKIIVSLTTWAPRIMNIPVVLDSIFAQTVQPDIVVLNLSEGENVPETVDEYLKQHDVEVHFVPDTKVYKKLIPTLRRYPDDCVIAIDDDWIYPAGMIADFVTVHKNFPGNPISGNRVIYHGNKCHCGCASLMKLEWLGRYVDLVDDEFMKGCPCDDLAYTYLVKKNGLKYVCTTDEYSSNMQSYCASSPYSESDEGRLAESWNYLVTHYGTIWERIVQIVRKRKKRS